MNSIDKLIENLPDSFEVVTRRKKRVVARVENKIVTMLSQDRKQLYRIHPIWIFSDPNKQFNNKTMIEYGDELFDKAFMTEGIRELMRSGHQIVPINPKT